MPSPTRPTIAISPRSSATSTATHNNHLGAEYFNIARSIAKGRGFASPFGEQTGPTAWMPPILPGILAGLLWACDGDKDAVMAVVIFFQVCTLVATGLLVIALAGRASRLGGSGGGRCLLRLSPLPVPACASRSRTIAGWSCWPWTG